jgi:hypothetical protein
MTIGKLDVEKLAGRDGRNGPNASALVVPHQRIASLQHALITQTGEELSVGIELPVARRDGCAHGTSRTARETVNLLDAPRHALAEGIRSQTAADALEPGAMRRRCPRQGCRLATGYAVKLAAGAFQPRFDELRGQTRTGPCEA